MYSMRCGHCPPPPASSHAIIKTERAPRSLSARPDGKALRSVSSSAVGLQNPTAGDTGLPEPLQGLPNDSIEIARTVAVGTGSLCQSFGKEAIGDFGVRPGGRCLPSVSNYPARFPFVTEGAER
jgi:hypothetical protein